MNFFGGIVGGVLKGAEDVAKTGAEVAGGVVGGTAAVVGGAVEGTGEVIESVGEALSGKKKEKRGLKEVILDDLKNDGEKVDDNKMDEGDESVKLDKDEDDENWDEAESKLAKPEKEERVVTDMEEDKDVETQIPKHFSLKSKHNNKYLRYTNEDAKSEGLLRYTGNKVVSPYSKFEVRASKTEKRLVHIRCCYNNKFWARLSADSNYIAAVADEEEEDKTKLSCTLFEPIFDYDENAYRIRCIQTDSFLRVIELGVESDINSLLLGSDNDKAATVDSISTIVDWDSIFMLPKYVGFKGNNGSYLEPSGVYLKFSASSTEDPSAAFEIISTNDGCVRIKHVQSGNFWIRDPNWIHCKSIDIKKDNPNTLFWPVKVDDKTVAFRNMGNNNFCKRLTTEGKTNCLNAAVRTITDTARLEVTEIVVARSIENVNYRLEAARVYGKKVLTMSKGFAINKTDVDDKITMKFRYEKKSEKTWSSSVTKTLGFAARFTSKIPTVGKGKLEISFEGSKENSWGETEKEKSFEEMTETVTVPRMSKVKIGGIVTQASCDIPFSYTRRDTLKNGKQVVNKFEDGLFTGVTTLDFKFETERLPL